jgi:hypothetical protein
MAFATATVVTNKGKAMFADRVQTTAATYTTAPKFVRYGTGATAAARSAQATDTALSVSANTSTTGVESITTITNTGDVYRVVGTIGATGAAAIDEAGLFDAATVGNMFTSATHAVINLASGDSIQYTWNVQVT